MVTVDTQAWDTCKSFNTLERITTYEKKCTHSIALVISMFSATTLLANTATHCHLLRGMYLCQPAAHLWLIKHTCTSERVICGLGVLTIIIINTQAIV